MIRIIEDWLRVRRARKQAELQWWRDEEEAKERLIAGSAILHSAMKSYDTFSYNGAVHHEVINALWRSLDGSFFFTETGLSDSGIPTGRFTIMKCSVSRAREWLIASGGDKSLI